MKLLVAGVVLACSALAFADTPPTPTIKLLSAGSGPLRQLRFAPKKGTKRTMLVTTQESKARGLVGKLPPPEAQPAIRFAIDLEVVDVATNGDVRYRFAYREVKAVADKVTPEVARQVEAA